MRTLLARLIRDTEQALEAVERGDAEAVLMILDRRKVTIQTLRQQNASLLDLPDDEQQLGQRLVELDKRLGSAAADLRNRQQNGLVSIRQERVLRRYTEVRGPSMEPVLDIQK